MTTAAFRRLAWLAFLVCWALLPFETPIAEGVHGVFRHFIGEAYPALFIGSLLLMTAIATLLASRLPRSRLFAPETRTYLLLACAFVLLGTYALVVTVIRGAYLGNSVRQLVLGYLAPVAAGLVLLLSATEERRRAWFAFYVGFTVFLLGALASRRWRRRGSTASTSGSVCSCFDTR